MRIVMPSLEPLEWMPPTINLLKKLDAFLVYELHEDRHYARNIKNAAKNAEIVIVPEYCRSHIMQSRYNLKKRPMVLPNKSDIDFEGLQVQEDDKILEAIDRIARCKKAGFHVCVYMGGINSERPLEPFLDSIRDNGTWKLAAIGKSTPYLDDLIGRYYDVLIYLGYFSPPKHLSVARFCDVGILNYISINQTQGLNALFCAPNKIFEYTGLGLPVIGNDIPGLRYDIIGNSCGEVVDYDDSKSVDRALNKILSNYEEYSTAAKQYYNSVNVDAILKRILNSLERME